MKNIELNLLTEIKSLVESKIPEDIHNEYKSEINISKDSDKKESKEENI